MLALLLASGAARAATLDLATVAELARERANDARSADLAVDQQQIAVRTSRLAWTPDLQASVGAQGSLGRTFSEQVGANVTAPVASLSGSLVASMPLYQGGSLAADRRSAEASLSAAQGDRTWTDLDLQWTAIDDLLAVGEARAALQIEQAALEADQALLSQIEIQVTGGSRTPADRYAQESVVAARRSSIASATEALTEAQLALLSLLRLDPGQDWTFAPPEAAPELPADADSAVRSALAARPDLKAAAARVDAAREARRSAAGAFAPSVSLDAGTSGSWTSSQPEPIASQLADESRAWVAVDLTVPLLDRGVRRGRVDQADVAVQQAEVDRQKLEDAVALGVRELEAARDAAQAAVDAQEAAAESARKAAEVLELRYRAGSDTLVSLTAARAQQVDAELELTRAQSALRRLGFELAHAVGQLDVLS